MALQKNIYRHREKDLLWGVGSHDYEDWEVPQSAVCILEAQGGLVCSSSPNMEVWDQGSQWCEPPSQPQAEVWRTRHADAPVQEKRAVSAPAQDKVVSFLCSLVVIRLPATACSPPAPARAAHHSACWLRCDVSGNTLTDTPRDVYQLSGQPLAQPALKIFHHREKHGGSLKTFQNLLPQYLNKSPVCRPFNRGWPNDHHTSRQTPS